MSIFLRRVLNKLAPVSLADVAITTRELAPASETTRRPSFHMPGEFEAVLACVNGDMALEKRRVEGALQHDLPTIEYTLRNARIAGDVLASGRYIGRFRTNRPLAAGQASGSGGEHAGEVPGRDKREVVGHAILSSNSLSGLEFGHWVRDSLVTEMHGLNEGLASIGFARQPWPQEAEFRKFADLFCRYSSDCRVDRLVVLDDRGHNPHWRARFLAVRARMRTGSAIAHAGPSAGERVFLSRGKDGRVREPSNIEAIERDLVTAGFQVINPSAMSVQQVASALRDAKVVVGTEGSNLNHLHYFAPDGLKLVCIQDPNRFYAYHKSMMDTYDGRFGFVVGRPDPDLPGRHIVNVDTIKRTIDLMEDDHPPH